MAHNLSVTDGVVEMAYAGKTPWHGLGQGTPNGLPLDSTEMMKLAHLDWQVGMEQVYSSSGIEMPGKLMTFRRDNRTALGIVSDNYGLVQNHEAFDWCDSLLQDGVIKYETAGALKGGRIIWVLARMPSIDHVTDSDTLVRYVLFVTSHDGSMRLHAIPTPTRVVCWNTVNLAIQGLEGIRHIGNMSDKLELARKFVSQWDSKFTLYRDDARALTQVKYTQQEKLDYIKAIFKGDDIEAAGQTSKRGGTIAKQRTDTIDELLTQPNQTIDGIGGTWWSLHNAITEFIDHKSTFKGGNERIKAENRFISLADGDGAKRKSAALKMALAGAGV